MARPDIAFTVAVEGAGESAANVDRLGVSFKSLFKAFAATVGVITLKNLAVESFELAAGLEQSKIAVSNFVGSGEKATALLNEWETFAAKTPFRFKDIEKSGRLLLAFGDDAATVTDTVKRIGDISAGTSNNLAEVSIIYGKLRVQGRAFAEDINQFTGRGIPIIGELAKQFGVADSEVKDLVASGKVGFKDVEQAFRSMTSEGGKFFGLTEKLALSSGGKLSTMLDNIEKLKRQIGEKLLPIASAAFDTITASIQRVFFGMKDVKGGSQDLDNAFMALKATAESIVPAFQAMISFGKDVVAVLNAIAAPLKAIFGEAIDDLAKFKSAINDKAAIDVFSNFAVRVGATNEQMKAFQATVTDVAIWENQSDAILELDKRWQSWSAAMREAAMAGRDFSRAESLAGFSANQLTDRIVFLNESLDRIVGEGWRKQIIQQQIDATTGALKKLNGELSSGADSASKYAAGSIGALEERITGLQKEIKNATDSGTVDILTKQIEGLNIQIGQIKFGTAAEELRSFVSTIEGMDIAKVTDFGGVRADNSGLISAWIDPIRKTAEEAKKVMADFRLTMQTEFKSIGQGAISDLAGGFGDALRQITSGAMNAADAFTQMALAFTSNLTRAVGMALITNSMNPGAVASGLGIAMLFAGIGLVGLSGVIAGFGDRKKKRSGMEDIGAPTGGSTPSPSFGALSLATGQTDDVRDGWSITVYNQIDGTDVAGRIRDIEKRRARQAGR